MIVIPAIDLKDGRVVRLKQGRAEDETVYSSDPLAMARRWKKEGAEFVHIVDLNGAFSGQPGNLRYVREIAEGVDLKIEFGGGIRDIKIIEELIGWGIERVVLGTGVVLDEPFLDEALERFQDRIVVSIDVKEGLVATSGWKATSRLKPPEFACLLVKKGLKRLIYTDISRDGMLSGPNLAAAIDMLRIIDIPLIISGGISSLDDIKRISNIKEGNIEGVIVGRALYENRFSLKEAIKIAKNTEV